MSQTRKSKPLLYASMACVALGILIALVLSTGPIGAIVGGIVAVVGVIPALYLAWLGIQEETQANLALAITMVVVSFCVGAGILVVAGIKAFR